MDESGIDRLESQRVGRGGALDHDDIEPKITRRFDLRVGGAAAAVLRHDNLDPVPEKQLPFVFTIEGTARENVGHLRHLQRRIDGIDAANQIIMQRRCVEMMRLLPADRQKHVSHQRPECGSGIGHRADGSPAIARLGLPRRPADGDCGDIGGDCGGGGIGGDFRGEGMRGVYQQVDPFSLQITCEPVRAAEPADANRNRLGQRIGRSSSERQHRIELLPGGQQIGQPPCLGRAAQNKNAGFGHA